VERSEIIALLVADALANVAPDALLARETLPKIRAAVAADLGGSGADYYGTVDPLYYAAVGFAYPLAVSGGGTGVNRDGTYSAALARSVASRRRKGGRLARWDVLRASVASATDARIPSVGEVKALAERGGIDLDASYTGRGTRVGAPATYPVAPDA
jgi:hypothetical protein